MKTTKRIVSMILVLVMSMSVLCASAAAETKNGVAQFKSYVAIGSSITRGCGLTGYGYFDETTMHVIPGDYPDMVAKAVGLESSYTLTESDGEYIGANRDKNYYSRFLYTFQGMTIASLVSVMGLADESIDSFLTDEEMPYANKFYPAQKQLFGEGTTYTDYEGNKQSSHIRDLLKTCELITIEIGMGDVVYRPKEISGLFDGHGTQYNGIVSQLTAFIKEVYAGYDAIEKYYPMVLDFIRENNPEATVVLVGSYNVVGGLTLTEQSYAPFGDAIESITTRVNKLYKKLAEKYGYIYADISDTETPPMQGSGAILAEDFMGDMNAAVHPALNDGGLGYIARQIINTLKDEEADEKEKYDIVVDMGSISSVSSVKVNGISVTDYEVDGTVLTIHYNNGLAMSVSTVTTDKESGKMTTRLYRLTYNTETGYTAGNRRGINDYLGKLNFIPNLLKDFFAKLFGLTFE